MEDQAGLWPLRYQSQDFARRRIAVQGSDTRGLLQHAECTAEGTLLHLHGNPRSAIEAEFADVGRSLRERSKAPWIEGSLNSDKSGVATDAPDRGAVGPLESVLGLVERTSNREYDSVKCFEL